jgi:two-component system CheB/CheR fusion protein
LNPKGFLTLGVSESLGAFAHLFFQVDKKQKIFARKMTADRPALEFPRPAREAEPAEVAADQQLGGPLLKSMDIYQEADRIILHQYAPAGVLINEQFDILQFRGDTSHFLRPAPGRASHNLLQMAREGMLMELRSALAQCQKSGGVVERDRVRVRFDGRFLEGRVRVIPLVLPSPQPRYYVIVFEEEALPVRRRTRRGQERELGTGEETERQLNVHLAQELEATKQYLQSLIERYEAANEELKSANEEILSSNEELQSTNEELETAKEELQSTNEELSTVNDELRQRNQDLGEANNDLNNLFSSANLPIIVLSSDLRIRRFTVAAERVLNVIPTDIGRPIGHLNLNIPIPDLESLILEAIDSMSIKEREVQDREEHWYCLRVRPYRTTDNRIDGAMLLFIDIDSFKDIDRLSTLLSDVDTARHFAEGVVQSAPWPLLILDHQLHVSQANSMFYQFFQTTPEDTEQQLVFRLGNGTWDIPELHRLLAETISDDSQFHDVEITQEFPRIREKSLRLNARRVGRDEQATDVVLLGLQDITAHRQTEAEIAAALREKDMLLREIYHRVKNNLQIVSSLLALQADTITDQSVRDVFQESQQRIQAMALVHQRLYASENLTHIDTITYLQHLVGDLSRIYDPEGHITYDIQAAGEMNLDTAIPVGLILTELISNAFKYAFPGGRSGQIRVTLRTQAEGRWQLVVQDNGIGIPEDLNITHIGSLGLTLVHDLVSQLNGTVQLDRSGGTTFIIQFSSMHAA